MSKRGSPDGPCYERRAILGLALAPLLIDAAQAQDAAAMPPQPGDRLVFLTGPKKGQAIKVDDLPVGGPQVQAYPMSPDGTVRNGSRLNLTIVARFDPAEFDNETKARSGEGVVAYAATCTHQGCPVNAWSKDRQAFVCSCHGSVFDPRHGGELLFGPAPRPLPALGVKVADGNVVVASAFNSRVGGEQK